MLVFKGVPLHFHVLDLAWVSTLSSSSRVAKGYRQLYAPALCNHKPQPSNQGHRLVPINIVLLSQGHHLCVRQTLSQGCRSEQAGTTKPPQPRLRGAAALGRSLGFGLNGSHAWCQTAEEPRRTSCLRSCC